MKKSHGLAFGLLFLMLGMCAMASPLPIAVNVRDFGAKGDGIVDDTASIQAAANESGRQARIFPFPWAGGYPELVFPEGTYRITRPIVLGLGANPSLGMQSNGKPWNIGALQGAGFAYVRGIGRAVLRQTDPSQDIFYVGHAYRAVIEKLAFEGGFRGIRLWNGNHDKCVVLIRDCRFSNTASYAVEMMEIYVSFPSKAFSGYARADAAGRLSEVHDPQAAPLMFSSTYLHIDGCEFRACLGVLSSACDMATLENSSIETAPEMKGAAIRTVGLLKAENVRGLAHVRPGNHPRWMDLAFGNSPQIYARHLNLETATGVGMPVVYSLARLRGTGNVNCASVVIQDSAFHCAGSPENAVVYCPEVPNRIVVSGCTQTGKTAVPAIGLGGPHIDEDYFETYDNIGSKDLTPVTNRGAWIPVAAQGLAYLVEDGNRNIDGLLPEAMKAYGRAPLPSKDRGFLRNATSSSKADFLGEPQSAALVTRRLSAEGFGLVGDGMADDSDAVQKALDAAAGPGLTELVFPGAVYLITRPMRVPPRVVVRGSGRAAFLTPSGVDGGFVVEGAQRVAFLNLTFDSGKRQIDVSVRKGEAARVLIDNCTFQNAGELALACRSEDEAWAGRTNTRLRVMNCVFDNNRQDLINNVDAAFDSHWMSSQIYAYRNFKNIKERSREGNMGPRVFAEGDPYRDLALIRNEGRLRLENVVGVPTTRTFRRDIRWIDNRGMLFADFFRFGGENGGFPTAYLLPPAGDAPLSLVLQNCWMNHKLGSFYYPGDADALRPTAMMVMAKALPESLILANNCGFEKSQVPAAILGPTVQFEAGRVDSNAFRARLAFSANTIPEDLASREERGTNGPQVKPVRIAPGPGSAGRAQAANLIKNGGFEKCRVQSLDASSPGGWGELIRRGHAVGTGPGTQALPKDWAPNPNAGWPADSRSAVRLVSGAAGSEVRTGSNAIFLASDKYGVLLSDVPLAVGVEPGERDLSLSKPNRFLFWAKGRGRLALGFTTYLKSGVDYNAFKATPSEFALESGWKCFEGSLEFTNPEVGEARCFLRLTCGEAVVDGIEVRAAP